MDQGGCEVPLIVFIAFDSYISSSFYSSIFCFHVSIILPIFGSAKVIKLMDNLEDWLYIIFLVIAAISGLFSSKNKKRKRSVMQPEPESGSMEADDSFEPMLYPEPEYPPEPTIQVAQKIEPLTPSYQHMPSASSLSSRKAMKEERAEDVEETYRDMDEWRKAIIYAEIMNRKY